jgi:2-oxo-4-hydroxy-4-carboxy-5-ureidoimidazoline decarboxylase
MRVAVAVAKARPFEAWEALVAATNEAWASCTEVDVREAAAHHPRIGADRAVLRAKFAPTAAWSSEEQAGVSAASEEVLDALAAANEAYAEKFGYTFLVCATGKSAPEMLEIATSRLGNDPTREWQNAREELRKITLIRLQKLDTP